MQHQFDRIPREMRNYAQWILWRYEETEGPKPTKIPYSPHGPWKAAVDAPDTWGSFEQAVSAYLAGNGYYSGIGFVLTKYDPFAFIDLDDTEGDPIALNRQLEVYKHFASYSELSPSGKGLHIIVYGSVPSGRRRSKIEVYSDLRYMTMTGNVYNDAPIEHRQDLLDILHSQIGADAAVSVYGGDLTEKETDDAIIERAGGAINGGKFSELFSGNWQQHYSSQSEADFALIDIIAFYTQSRIQIARIFRQSGLGKRDKAYRDDYMQRMINRSFDRMLPPIDFDGISNMYEDYKAKVVQADTAKREQNALPAPDASEQEPHADIQQPGCAPAATPHVPNGPPPVNFPAGLVGEIADFIYRAAPRPVAEAALCAALALVSGIAGRAYNISDTGLNQYIMLLAPTGSGKEAMASGIDKLIKATLPSSPKISKFIGPAKLASDMGLIKQFSRQGPCFVTIVGEVASMLAAMSDKHASSHIQGLKQVLLDLYNKSGQGRVLRPTVYSDKDKNTEEVIAPCFTLLGESPPETFYRVCDETMVEDGLLPRISIIEFTGKRPPLNENAAKVRPSFQLIERLGDLAKIAVDCEDSNAVIPINQDATAESLLRGFDKYCDKQMNDADKEVVRHMWNRAHVKALKLAGQLAVGCNPYSPLVNEVQARWAIDLATHDVTRMLARFSEGKVGIGSEELKQMREVRRVVGEYISSDWGEVKKYVATQHQMMHATKVVTQQYISRRLASTAPFRKDVKGSTFSIIRAIKNLVDDGLLQEVGLQDLQKFGFTGKAYVPRDPAAFLEADK